MSVKLKTAVVPPADEQSENNFDVVRKPSLWRKVIELAGQQWSFSVDTFCIWQEALPLLPHFRTLQPRWIIQTDRCALLLHSLPVVYRTFSRDR